MPNPQIYQFTVWEGGCTLLARMRGRDGTYLLQSQLSSIACSIFNEHDLAVALSSPAVVVATSIFNILQTDARWTIDTTGYNFRHDIPAASIVNPAIIYRVQYTFTPVAGDPFPFVANLNVLNLR